MAEESIPPAPQSILDVARLASRHPAIIEVKPPFWEATDGGKFVLELLLSVSLPSRARRLGISSTGVKGSELCRLEFCSKWPSRAPKIALRRDFPLNLPHIDPHSDGDYVRPCIYAGSLSELMHRMGFLKVIDQLADWIDKAASGQLMNLDQGWEPTRRDNGSGHIYLDSGIVAEHAAKSSEPLRMLSRLRAFNEYFFFHCGSPATDGNLEIGFTCEQDSRGNKILQGQTAATVFFADRVNGELPVISHYTPDTASDYTSLLSVAESFGINPKLVAADLNRQVDAYKRRTNSGFWPNGLHLAVILAVRRPVELIGQDNEKIELVPYIVSHHPIPSAQSLKHAKTTAILPISTVTPEVLRRTSGETSEGHIRKFVWLGVGSLGSKVALHLLRSGIDNHRFIDNDFFEPHNIARHALTDLPGMMALPLKALEMERKAVSMGLSNVDSFAGDIVNLISDRDKCAEFIPDDALVIDSTASYSIVDAVGRSMLSPNGEHRYVRLSLLGAGRAGLMIIEGRGRNPSISDLLANLYTICAFDEDLKTLMSEAHDVSPELVYGGQNCASVTTVMSDSLVSIHAAYMARQICRWRERGTPEAGQILIRLIDEESGPTKTFSENVVTSHILNEDGWEIRILDSANQTIQTSVTEAGRNEAGGLLIGHVDVYNRKIIVTKAIPAPPDSRASQTSFTLGVDGLFDIAERIARDSFGQIRMLGTWHSHPKGGGASPTDIRTLREIGCQANGFPAVSLIWTPTGFNCPVLVC